ncbi:hypothetical protein EV360DRAFT_90230 [Lentinula raphanica]|nr:hypothetical protein EV360DRAFT_90230 [Lentinula raphanica]
MDAIDEALATGMIDNQAVSQPIRHALAIGKKTMNKYYALTDDSDIYRMAIISFSTTKQLNTKHSIAEVDRQMEVTKMEDEEDVCAGDAQQHLLEGSRNEFGNRPPSQNPLISKQAIIVLREELEYFSIPPKDGSVKIDQNGIAGEALRNVNKENNVAEQHLIDMLLDSTAGLSGFGAFTMLHIFHSTRPS